MRFESLRALLRPTPTRRTWQVRDRLEQLGFTLGGDLFYYLDQGGCHSEAYWGARLRLPLRVLYPPPPSDVIG